jgi:hypothetical protein
VQQSLGTSALFLSYVFVTIYIHTWNSSLPTTLAKIFVVVCKYKCVKKTLGNHCWQYQRHNMQVIQGNLAQGPCKHTPQTTCKHHNGFIRGTSIPARNPVPLTLASMPSLAQYTRKVHLHKATLSSHRAPPLRTPTKPHRPPLLPVNGGVPLSAGQKARRSQPNTG